MNVAFHLMNVRLSSRSNSLADRYTAIHAPFCADLAGSFVFYDETPFGTSDIDKHTSAPCVCDLWEREYPIGKPSVATSSPTSIVFASSHISITGRPRRSIRTKPKSGLALPKIGTGEFKTGDGVNR
jgi:hypothetical protein